MPDNKQEKQAVEHKEFTFGVLEDEQARWQDAIYALLCNHVPDNKIDGAGSDSGDPLDFTLSEIQQALAHFEDELESLRAQLTQSLESKRLRLEQIEGLERELAGVRAELQSTKHLADSNAVESLRIMKENSDLRAELATNKAALENAYTCHQSEVVHLREQLKLAHDFACDPDVHHKHCGSLKKDHWGSGDFPCNCKPDILKAYNPKEKNDPKRLALGGDRTDQLQNIPDVHGPFELRALVNQEEKK